MARQRLFYTIMSAKAATGVGNTIYCSDFRNAIVTIATAGSPAATLTVNCKGATGNSAPTFTSAASSTNMWDTVQMIDLQDGNPINGDTGLGFTATNEVRQFEVNINALDYINFDVTAFTQGTVTITIILTDNY